MSSLHAMFVHAHPDDESSKGAATMARYAKEGYRISVVTLTDGMRGDILNPAMDRPGVKERMIDIRAVELARALEILGVSDHYGLGYHDSGYVEDFNGNGSVLAADAFYNIPQDEVVERLVALVRRERPQVLITYPPGGGYPHPDHIRCHDVSVAAFEAAADPQRFPDAGPLWHVSKLYYSGVFTRTAVQTLHQACLDRGLESPFTRWLDRWDGDEPDPTTTRIEVAEYLGVRKQALIAHATQVDPTGPWFEIPEELVREVYPYEEFVLAHSTVDTPLPEESMFSGLE